MVAEADDRTNKCIECGSKDHLASNHKLLPLSRSYSNCPFAGVKLVLITFDKGPTTAFQAHFEIEI